MTSGSGWFLGIFEGHYDPAVALVRHGELVAFAEEERFIRQKHAYKVYPHRALRFCLDQVGIGPEEVQALGINWNVAAFTDGRMRAFFQRMEEDWPLDDGTRSWQRSMLARFRADAVAERHAREWRRHFGAIRMPPIDATPHHLTHALHAYHQSGFDRALTLTIDGSGDEHCTVLWACEGEEVRLLHEIVMPHSLGWFYAAFTEYLGFRAYNGEYKVMGLAAYGREDESLKERVARILDLEKDGPGYRIDPSFIHYGAHTWSDRFTDRLPELFGRPRRLPHEPIEPWHRDLALAVQRSLEEAVIRLARWGLEQVGTGNLCVGGGVGLNVKMNTRLHALPEVESIFIQPLCSDGGAAAGAALASYYKATGQRPPPLRTLALGNEEPEEVIEDTLQRCGLAYERPADIAGAVAGELAEGRIVGWFQGRMEAGPRALGQRSILADPRSVESRDRVNAVIKYREPWRPFCPSMVAEAADTFFQDPQDAPFMILALRAEDALSEVAPAIVHVDHTSRVQLVEREVQPLYHQLISEFGRRTGVPVVLNTSFNVKGEPIVCTIQDALRTFFSTGLDLLAAGPFLLRKPVPPLADAEPDYLED